ncbi:homeobox domain protein [Ceratobasidium sp. AG-Ba]|nr:homeobox domain protein [Ceratobasidium sp. AG-Ba]
MTDVPPGASDKRRTKLTWAQLVRLEGIFAQTWYPSWADKDALAREFALEHQQINVWFCNRRTKAKREKEHMPDSFIPSHAQAALKSIRARHIPSPRDPPTPERAPMPERDSPPSSRASSTAPDPRALVLPPIRTDDDARRPPPAPVSAESAASIQAQLSSSLSAALLGSSSAAYRTPYRPDDRDRDRDRSPSPAHPHPPRHRSNSAGARHSPYAARQHTYPFTHRARSRSGSPPQPTLAPIGRPDYAQALPSFHTAAGLPPALPAPPNTKPHDPYTARYASGDIIHACVPLLAHPLSDPQVASPTVLSPSDDPRKALLAQPIQAPPHVGALQSAPHVGAFHSMPVVGVFQGTAPPPTELPISVWQAHPLVRTRARITREQLRALEALFAKTWFPTSQQRAEAASVTGMREYSVTVWFQNRRSKAKKEGLQPPEGDRSKLRKDKGPKRDLGTHVFEVGSSRHPEPMAAPATGTPYASAPAAPGTPAQNLVWLEDARSRGLAPVMKTNGSQSGYAENAADRPGSPRSWTDAEGELESDAEMESEADSRPRGSSQPQYQLRDDSSRVAPGYGRAYTHPPPRESKQPSYPPREAHPSYATVGNSGPNRHGSTSGSASPLSTPSSLHHVAGLPRSVSPQNGDGKTQLLHPHSSAGPRRRDSSHSHPASEDAPGSDLAREPAADEDEPASESDRPAKRSRRENEHAREDVGRGGDSVRHRPSPARDEMTA